MRGVAVGRTPVPICNPVGSCVCCDVFEPAWRTFWYSRSSNATRERLKPVVPTLARLLATTSSCVCCASRPVLLIQRLRIMSCYSLAGESEPAPAAPRKQAASAAADQAVGFLFVLLRVVEQLQLHFELARRRDHSDHCVDHVHVASFELSGGKAHRGIGVRIAAFLGAEQSVVALGEFTRRRIDQLQATYLIHRRLSGELGRDGPVVADRDA